MCCVSPGRRGLWLSTISLLLTTFFPLSSLSPPFRNPFTQDLQVTRCHLMSLFPSINPATTKVSMTYGNFSAHKIRLPIQINVPSIILKFNKHNHRVAEKTTWKIISVLYQTNTVLSGRHLHVTLYSQWTSLLWASIRTHVHPRSQIDP